MLVIVESPFQGDHVSNTHYLTEALKDCCIRGESPYASHAILTRVGVLDDNNPREREIGIKLGFLWHSKADKMVVYCDYGISLGMKLGIENAHKVGLCVEYRYLRDCESMTTLKRS